jgi:hypothetical protein
VYQPWLCSRREGDDPGALQRDAVALLLAEFAVAPIGGDLEFSAEPAAVAELKPVVADGAAAFYTPFMEELSPKKGWKQRLYPIFHYGAWIVIILVISQAVIMGFTTRIRFFDFLYYLLPPTLIVSFLLSALYPILYVSAAGIKTFLPLALLFCMCMIIPGLWGVAILTFLHFPDTFFMPARLLH